MSDNWVELNTNTLKIDKVNFLALTSGFKKNDKTIKTAILVAGSNQATSLNNNFREIPKLMTLSDKEYKLSKIGEDLRDGKKKITYKYIAVLRKIYHIKNKIEVWDEFCHNGIFDIFDKVAPYNTLNKKKIKPFQVGSEQYDSSKQRADPMILLMRICEIDREYSTNDFKSKGEEGYNDHFDVFKDDVNRNVLFKESMLSDNEFYELDKKIDTVLKKYNAYSDKRETEILNIPDIDFEKDDGGKVKPNKVEDPEINLLLKKKQIILYGPPGTGKTFNTRSIAVNAISGDQEYQKLRDEGRVEFITFHPSYSYEEFVEGITVDVETSGEAAEELNYKLKQGIFKLMVIRAIAEALGEPIKNENGSFRHYSLAELLKKYKEEIKQITSDTPDSDKLNKVQEWWNNKPIFVLVIDEINRGDISKIFGELITLLEADKRLGMDNELTARLPYSQEEFAVPPNLYIVGTMNTADKSIALIDVALRRRFGFIEKSPDFEILEKHIEDCKGSLENGVYGGLENSIKALERINDGICSDHSVGRDKQIGHSFLFKVKTQSDLIMVWQNEILPLLEEYYYGQYPRINRLLFNKEGDTNWISEKDGILGFSDDFHNLTKFLTEVIGE